MARILFTFFLYLFLRPLISGKSGGDREEEEEESGNRDTSLGGEDKCLADCAQCYTLGLVRQRGCETLDRFAERLEA